MESLQEAVTSYMRQRNYESFARYIHRELWSCPEQVYAMDRENELPALWRLCLPQRSLARRLLQIMRAGPRHGPHQSLASAAEEFRMHHCKRKASDLY